MKKVILFLVCILVMVPASAGFAEDKKADGKSDVQQTVNKKAQEAAEAAEEEREKSTLEMLYSIEALKNDLKKRMTEKKMMIKKAGSETEKGTLTGELEAIDKQLANAVRDFERIATGVDITLFDKKEPEPFNWKNEVLSLAEPGILEIKRMTVKARNKSKLKDKRSSYEELLPVAVKARTRIEGLIKEANDKMLQKSLKEILPEYKGVESQIANKLDLIRMQLDEIEREEASVIDSTQDSVKHFFRTRGLSLTIAVVACLGVILLLRLLGRNILKMMPGYKSKYRPFHIRLVELIFQGLTIVFSLLSVVIVFYIFEDWVLLSLCIILLMGLVWAAKSTLPKYVNQSRLILNIGAVREGERIMYHGVPWLVKQINFYSILENPTLGIKLRIPIEDLLDKTSREFHRSEAWFPCRKDDWVILSDGTRGGVVHLSHETVELVLRGGSRKTYLTSDFLAMTPLNLSVNFRLKVPFGIGYVHQGDATSSIPERLQAHLQAQIEAEGYADDMLNLKVEFAEAGACSLDMVVIADFKGKVAPLYNRLRRAIQRWCVDAASIHNWEIPFPQMVIHKG
ncbi:MAG: hypothetical protein CSA25_01145 [Desulfobacter postgatei]|uniref:Mechanosensitive ion channel protein MscS n=1 Tax=Desulfobacter postgatei TaxID=2293 RepID=A0A2G6MT51_9BACT|nr:MAG: hypothetical protein CSA25_01145 [Desulfobacter postgatei]